MAKHIGIVACSAEGAALCYRTICMEAPERMGEHRHPEITMHTCCLGDYMQPIYAGDWGAVAERMIRSLGKVAGAGAELAICPDNTLHQVFDRVAASSPIPWIHIAHAVAEEARRRGFRKLGILGTRYLMEGPVYPDALRQLGTAWETPGSEDRLEIDRIIFEELVNARFTDSARARFHEVIEGLGESGCDAVVLGCTEIPLIVDPATSPLPTLDSTRLLARAALAAALGEPRSR